MMTLETKTMGIKNYMELANAMNRAFMAAPRYRYERDPDATTWHELAEVELDDDDETTVGDLLSKFADLDPALAVRVRVSGYDDGGTAYIRVGENRPYSPEEKAAIVAENAEIRAERAAEKEAKERAEFERLAAKFGEPR
jgi:hypothetical protein